MAEKRTVSGVVSWYPLVACYETMRSAGLPDSAFSAETLAAVAEARATHGFVKWEVLIALTDEARKGWGTDEHFMRACEHLDGAVHEVRGFAPPGMTVQQFCRLIIEGFDGAVYPDLSLEVRELSDTRAEVEVHLPPSYPDSTSWLVGSVGAFRTLTRHLKLPPTQVEAELSSHHGLFRLTFPLGERPQQAEEAVDAARAIKLIEHLRDDVRRAIAATPAGTSHAERVSALSAAWRLTPRQAQVLDCVCQGLANKEISAGLRCSVRTVELHVGDIFRKAGVESRNQLLALFARGAPGSAPSDG